MVAVTSDPGGGTLHLGVRPSLMKGWRKLADTCSIVPACALHSCRSPFICSSVMTGATAASKEMTLYSRSFGKIQITQLKHLYLYVFVAFPDELTVK